MRSASFPIKLADKDDARGVRAAGARDADEQGPSSQLPPPPKKENPDGLETVVLELDGKAHDLSGRVRGRDAGVASFVPLW